MFKDHITIQKAAEGFRIMVKYVPCGKSFYRFQGHIGESMEPEDAFALIRDAIENIRGLAKGRQK
jgi:hypothetical protein